MLSAVQFAASEQMPVPAIIVTLLLEIEHAPPAASEAVVLAFVVVATLNVELIAALAGAPVNVTVGAIFVAVVDWLAVAEL